MRRGSGLAKKTDIATLYAPYGGPVAYRLGRALGIHEITVLTALKHRVSIDDILGRRRYGYLSRPRREAMAAAYRTGRFSYQDIADFFSRDRTTVMANIRTAVR